jgi:carboxyl-terminal processing protease
MPTKLQSDEESKLRRLIILIIFALLLSGSSFYAGFCVSNYYADQADASAVKLDAPKIKVSSKDFDAALFTKVWNMLTNTYVDHDQLDQKKMFYGALRGLVASAGDPYTVFFDPEENEAFQSDVSGKFEGIGAEIGLKDEIITIIAPLSEMPAEKAGLRAGDKIIEIDGLSTVGLTVDAAVKKIRGPEDTTVVLTIVREGAKDPLKITVKRAVITIKSVKVSVKDGVSIIKISNFNESTDAEFNQAVTEVLAGKSKDLIIDLRNNPGGYLDVAINMIGRWIGTDVAVIEKYSQDRQIPHSAKGPASLKDFHTVVLVNEGSASASEILAGALQDYGLGVLVGKKTFGKGSVQTLEELSDGSSVKITAAKWLTPKGRSINKEGIEPDLEVTTSEADLKAAKDTQLNKALEVLKHYQDYRKP